jgi:hypothetical protein
MQAWAAPWVTQRPLRVSGYRTMSMGIYLRAMVRFRQRLGRALGSPGFYGVSLALFGLRLLFRSRRSQQASDSVYWTHQMSGRIFTLVIDLAAFARSSYRADKLVSDIKNKNAGQV